MTVCSLKLILMLGLDLGISHACKNKQFGEYNFTNTELTANDIHVRLSTNSTESILSVT